MKRRHVHMEVVSLLMCIPPVTISLFPLVSITFLFKITNIHISSQSLPTIKQAVTRLKPFGCIVRQSHTEILSQEEEKIENKKTNLKIYIISFHIRTMHTTGNPPEKNHDCNINYTGIQRQYWERKADSRIQFTCLCHSLPVKTHKLAFLFCL